MHLSLIHISIFQGTSGTFWAWIGAHWLPLTCVLVLAGLTIDIMVYILRWRPQYVWRSWLHRIFRTKNERMAEQQFDAGYDQGVQSFSFMDEPIPDIMETAPDEQLSRAITRYDVQSPAQPADTAVVRRRRSERHGRHLPVFRRLRTERNEDSDVYKRQLKAETPVRIRSEVPPKDPDIDTMSGFFLFA